jgi:hypothetical protein
VDEKSNSASPDPEVTGSNGEGSPDAIGSASQVDLLEDVPSGAQEVAQAAGRRTRTPRTYPASSFMEALPLAEAIQKHAAGQRIRRLRLFELIGRAADSGPSRQLITNSGQYGITTGSYKAEFLELTEEGKLASSDESAGQARLAARLNLAIEKIHAFKMIYDEYKNSRIPAAAVLLDFVSDKGIAADNVAECVQTFLANARDLGLLRNYAGAERLLSFETVLEEVGESSPGAPMAATLAAVIDRPRDALAGSPAAVIAAASDLSDVCFVIAPIGDEGSIDRKHSDLVLGSLIEPALEKGFALRIVRSDKISKPGVISAQVIDHLVRSPLVIADLSYSNPNVFYELALRHAVRRPVVQLIRSTDRLPFDVGQFRTVVIDMTDIYTLVPQIETYRAEIARQCRAALEEDGPAESPLSLFYPKFWDAFVARAKRAVAVAVATEMPR